MLGEERSRGQKCILLIENNYKDLLLMGFVLEEEGLTGSILAVHTAAEAIDYLLGRTNLRFGEPTVIFLDINLPDMHGIDVLAFLHHYPRLRQIPVVIFTDSHHREDQERAYELGAVALKVKPVNFNEFMEAFRGLVKPWKAILYGPRENSQGRAKSETA